MDGSVSHQCLKQNMHTASSKCVLQKDLWLVTRDGSISDLESTLTLIKKNGVNINSQNVFGLTPLHIATWRNHIPIVRRLLAAGADPNVKDGESGWSSLHRAFHFGHLAVASVLLQSGAYISLEDSKSRIPVDFLSGPVAQVVGNEFTTELFSWGSGVNYQLGTGNAHIQKLPCKVDSLHGFHIKLISAAKFHSAAVNSCGEVYTWGFGRGGRLGHSEFDIHSGQAAVISPRKVTSGLGSRLVKAIAAAKHHTVVATEGGEVFSWGSNREGQLGYTSVDTQPTPRRVSSLRSRIGAVAAANKHTAVVSEAGEVFTWGCNREGQLGYGTSNSASNYTPRVVESLKGKTFKSVTAAKCHTIVLGADGEVFTWGHRLVTPRRVIIARNLKKHGGIPLKFHRKERLLVVAITAGMVHSMALTEDGALFFWVSSDPDLRCQQLYCMGGKHMVCIASGKYWTATVTNTGDVYMWDGKKGLDTEPSPTRLPGIKKATSVSVGETHLLIVASLYHPPYSPNNLVDNTEKLRLEVGIDLKELDGDCVVNDMKPNKMFAPMQKDHARNRSVPSLMYLCEMVTAKFLVEPRSSLQLLEIADSLEAYNLKKHCEEIVIRNLDYIITASGNAMANASLYILARLEKLLDLRSSDSWSPRRLPTPTATIPVIIYSDDDDSDCMTRGNHSSIEINRKILQKKDCFVATDNTIHVCKQVRALRKKLQQIETLESKQSNGQLLDEQQIAKLETKSGVESFLANLRDMSTISLTKNMKSPRESKKKQKKKLSRCDNASRNITTGTMKLLEIDQKSPVPTIESSPHSKDKVKILKTEETAIDKDNANGSSFHTPKKNNLNSSKNGRTTSKKKKGGLHMFLSGGLDDKAPVKAPVVSTPKTKEIPAWGGAKFSNGSVSLRKILDEQSKTCPDHDMDQVESRSGGTSLGSYFPTNSVPVEETHTTPPVLEEDRTIPSWGPSGASPFHCRPSLRDIQIQQVKQHQSSLCHTPTTQTSGFSVNTGQGSPLNSEGLNRWFKPEAEAPSSLRSIQIEEKAIRDFKRFYTSVKIVKKQF